MGIWSLLRRDKDAVDRTRSAMKAARRGDEGDDTVVSKAVEAFRDVGLDGKLTFASAGKVASRARRRHRNPEAAIKRIVRRHTRGVAIGGFATGLGGFLTMPVALPLNVAEFYLQATRMVGAIAAVRGYDLSDDEIRTAVLVTLVEDDAGDILRQAGLGAVSGRVSDQLAGRLPSAAMMMVNKAVGFRILRSFGEKSIAFLGKGVPLVGGLVGAAFDVYQLRQIAKAAKREFPASISV